MLNIMNRVRLYHALLALMAIAAYLTGEIFPAHAWLGYGVAFVIILRLLWAIGGERQVGLMRFYPKFDGLKLKGAATHPAVSRVLMLGIALSLLTVTGTGIAMDQGRAIRLQPAGLLGPVTNSETAAPRQERVRSHDDEEDDEEHEHGEDGPLSEVHELAANLLLLFVGLHVAYLLLFKRPLAKFMLFLSRGAKKPPAAPPPSS